MPKAVSLGANTLGNDRTGKAACSPAESCSSTGNSDEGHANPTAGTQDAFASTMMTVSLISVTSLKDPRVSRICSVSSGLHVWILQKSQKMGKLTRSSRQRDSAHAGTITIDKHHRRHTCLACFAGGEMLKGRTRFAMVIAAMGPNIFPETRFGCNIRRRMLADTFLAPAFFPRVNAVLRQRFFHLTTVSKTKAIGLSSAFHFLHGDAHFGAVSRSCYASNFLDDKAVLPLHHRLRTLIAS